MLDYIIVGNGLAGIAFAETALQNSKSILVFDNDSQNSSKVAAGIYNPVILKRFTIVPNALEQIIVVDNFYSKLENKLAIKFDFKMPVFRKFFSVEEQNNWFLASDNFKLKSFLNEKLQFTEFSNISSANGYGEVLQTGYINTSLLLKSYSSYLAANNLLIKDQFKYTNIQIFDKYLEYHKYRSRNIVFADGFGLHANPYFNHLPLDGTKGELFVIKALDLDLNLILNSSLYIVPLGDNLFKVGATNDWTDKSQLPTTNGREELVNKLKDIISCDFEIIEHLAGVRPTVKDRKPLVGSHPAYKNLHILNGLGTRGVMLAPFLAEKLFNKIEFGTQLPQDVDCNRYVL